MIINHTLPYYRSYFYHYHCYQCYHYHLYMIEIISSKSPLETGPRGQCDNLWSRNPTKLNTVIKHHYVIYLHLGCIAVQSSSMESNLQTRCRGSSRLTLRFYQVLFMIISISATKSFRNCAQSMVNHMVHHNDVTWGLWYPTLLELNCFFNWLFRLTLTQWGRDKMSAVLQTTFSNAFSWMKMHEFRLIFHWSLFLRFKLTIFQHWFR